MFIKEKSVSRCKVTEGFICNQQIIAENMFFSMFLFIFDHFEAFVQKMSFTFCQKMY